MEERVPVPGFGFLKPESRDYIEKSFEVRIDRVVLCNVLIEKNDPNYPQPVSMK